MALSPILLIGGTGIVGRQTAALLRAAHPDVPLLIGGRNMARAQEAARETGNAEAVTIDLAAADLGLGKRSISAVAIYFTDTTTAAIRFAQARRVPYISISPAMYEAGPEIAAYMHAPEASPIVLGTEWLVGATTIPTLEWARAFSQLDTIRIGAVLDERDEGGPASQDDLYRQTRAITAVQNRRDGLWAWRTGDARQSKFRMIDGTMIQGNALTVHDVYGLATETKANNVEFNLAVRPSAERGQSTQMPAEIIVELSGTDCSGDPLRSRNAVTHPQGQMPLTGLGVALLLERLTGLDGNPATKPGLYFPYQILNASTYFDRLRKVGGELMTLPPDSNTNS